MRNYRQCKAREIKLLGNGNLSSFPWIRIIYSISRGRTDLFHLKISMSMHKMNIATMAISEMVKLGVYFWQVSEVRYTAGNMYISFK
jgi:hypothetical protein